MCPDRQLISLYYDGELPSPWREKLEAHLESCEECRGILAGYRGIGECFLDCPQEAVQASSERVWKKLTSLVADGKTVGIANAASDAGKNDWAGWNRKKVWSRTISLPLPAAAAAILIVICFIALMAIGNANRSMPAQDAVAAANIGFDEQGTLLDIQDMNDVLKYLSSQDNIEFLVIQIPEGWNFSRSGEPALINAADYSRRRTSR